MKDTPLLSKLNWSRSLSEPCEDTEVPHDSLQCLVGTGIALQWHNHLKGITDRLVPNATWNWAHSNFYHLNTWEQEILACILQLTAAGRSQTAGSCSGLHCFLGDLPESFLDDTETAGSLHWTAIVISAVFALYQCLLCQICFGLRVEEICPSAKVAKPQIRKIKLHFGFLYALTGDKGQCSQSSLCHKFSNRKKMCLTF